MAIPIFKDTTPAPVAVWSGGATNPFGYVNLTTVPEFVWDGIYGTGGTITITLSSLDGRADVGTLTDPNMLGSLGFMWDGATNTYTEQSYNGPHPGVLKGRVASCGACFTRPPSWPLAIR